jgi:sarcosine oxidase
MTQIKFDVIVIGVGTMGSAACYNLASRGYNVLGIEQFDIPNEMSSHTGQSRIIRKAYFEHPDYIPLLEKAYDKWREFEKLTATKLFYQTGLLYAGLPDSDIIKAVRYASENYNITVDELTHEQGSKRFPQFNIPSSYVVLLEANAGFLVPELAIKLFSQQALKNGAVINTNEKVIGWEKQNGQISVHTDVSNYSCKKLIITAGPWANELVPSAKFGLKVTKQIIGWIEPKDKSSFEMDKCPCWVIADEGEGSIYYGFPYLDAKKFSGPSGIKFGYHFHGDVVEPNTIDRNPSESDSLDLRNIGVKLLSGEFSPTIEMKTCMYTNTPDENFVIDFLPDYDRDVIIATGFSGHGFKFAPVVGEILSDLAINEKTSHPIDFLSAKRFN